MIFNIQRFGGRGATSSTSNYMPKTFMYYSNRKRATINSKYENGADQVVKYIQGFKINDLKKYSANEILNKYNIDETINKTLKDFTNEEKKKVKDNVYKIYEFARKEIK